MPTSLRFHSSLVLQLAPELGSELLSALRGISSLLSCLHHYSVLFCPYHLGAVLDAVKRYDHDSLNAFFSVFSNEKAYHIVDDQGCSALHIAVKAGRSGAGAGVW